MTARTPAAMKPVSPVKRALIEIRDLRARLARAEAGRSAPIAIIGMGFRFPGGATDAESFAKLLWSGTDAVGPFPPIAGLSMPSMPRIPMRPAR